MNWSYTWQPLGHVLLLHSLFWDSWNNVFPPIFFPPILFSSPILWDVCLWLSLPSIETETLSLSLSLQAIKRDSNQVDVGLSYKYSTDRLWHSDIGHLPTCESSSLSDTTVDFLSLPRQPRQLSSTGESIMWHPSNCIKLSPHQICPFFYTAGKLLVWHLSLASCLDFIF